MEKKKFSLFAWMQKIPGGIILVPLFIGIFMNTFFPQALQIGGFTTGMFKTGTGCLLGLFLMLNGAAINVRHIDQPLLQRLCAHRCTYHSAMKMGKELPTLDVHAAMVREQDLPIVKEMLDANPSLKGFLLANHGAVAMGKKPMAAEYCAELIEETAQIAVLRKQLGTLAPLDF